MSDEEIIDKLLREYEGKSFFIGTVLLLIGADRARSNPIRSRLLHEQFAEVVYGDPNLIRITGKAGQVLSRYGSYKKYLLAEKDRADNEAEKVRLEVELTKSNLEANIAKENRLFAIVNLIFFFFNIILTIYTLVHKTR